MQTMCIKDFIYSNFITVEFRSYVNPDVYLDGFKPGKKINIILADNILLREFLGILFYKNNKDIGFVAINRNLVHKNRGFCEGDFIEVFSPIKKAKRPQKM